MNSAGARDLATMLQCAAVLAAVLSGQGFGPLFLAALWCIALDWIKPAPD